MYQQSIRASFFHRIYPNTKSIATKLVSLVLSMVLAFPVWISPATAQKRSIPLVRDAEIEALVQDYVRPILRAAGIKHDIQVILVDDMSFNAFVDGGRRIFINIGTLMQAETPNEVIGVVAHEIGHLAGGHMHRLREQMKSAQTMAVIGMLLGLGAAIGGGSSGNNGAGAAGGAIVAGSGEVAMRTVLSYQRSEEAAADRSAMTYLNRTGQSGKGMLATFARFSTALSLSGAKVDPYRISHPLPQERIAALETLAKESPYFEKKDPPELQLRHDMSRAKIAANNGNFAELRRMFASNPRGLPARYGEAIMAANKSAPKVAVAKVRALVKDQPNNPYFNELLGDVLVRANDANGAAAAYKRATSLDKRNSSLLRISYGRALLLSDNPRSLNTAITEIKAGIRNEPEFAAGYGILAMAYARTGQAGLADLATADMHYYSGRYGEARIFAVRAQRKLKNGSGDWLRAQDILSTTEKMKQGRG